MKREDIVNAALPVSKSVHCRYCGGDGYKCPRDFEINAEEIADFAIQQVNAALEEAAVMFGPMAAAEIRNLKIKD